MSDFIEAGRRDSAEGHLRQGRTRAAVLLALILAVVLTGLGCAGDSNDSRPNPVVLVGIDGASWIAIEDLWAEGRLPNLEALADRGVSTDLQPIADISPVIWTSFVTGVRPERHGITDFLLPTSDGDVPVSSTNRKVPAIWNMLTTVDRRVAVLGWWASWPAEEVNGVIVSDRALKTRADAIYPPELATRFQEIVDQTPEPVDDTLQAEIARQDAVIGKLAQQLLSEDFDLVLIYLRSPDVVSHPYWKYFQVPDSEEIDSRKVEKFGQRVPEAYAAVDRIIGELVEAAPPETNFFVTSDHGFTAVEGEEYRMLVDLNAVLEHLGYLVRSGEAIDWQQTRAVTWNSPPGIKDKSVRLGVSDRDPAGPVSPEDMGQVIEDLTASLGKVVHKNGSPLFSVRSPSRIQAENGADLAVLVHRRVKPKAVYYNGVEIPGVMQSVEELTGTHSVDTPGIFIAAGPDIDPTFPARAVHSLDIAPTLLFALGLPVAEDFDGRARTRLFQDGFQDRFPLTTIPSWGVLEAGEGTASEIDDELEEELRALGYLD